MNQGALRAAVCTQLAADTAELWQLEADIRGAETRHGRAACQELHDRLAACWERHLTLLELVTAAGWMPRPTAHALEN
jgi:hypothetical protein